MLRLSLRSLCLQTELYRDLAALFPADYEPEVEHSGKLAVLDELLRSMYTASPRQRVVLVSNYTQVSHNVHILGSNMTFLGQKYYAPQVRPDRGSNS